MRCPAFPGIQRLYIETAPLIDSIEVNPTYIARMDQIIKLIRQTPIQGVCSVVTLTEVLPIPLRANNTMLVQAYQAILLRSREFDCLPLDQTIAVRAAERRAQYNLKPRMRSIEQRLLRPVATLS